jgi:hypothetical protein
VVLASGGLGMQQSLNGRFQAGAEGQSSAAAPCRGPVLVNLFEPCGPRKSRALPAEAVSWYSETPPPLVVPDVQLARVATIHSLSADDRELIPAVDLVSDTRWRSCKFRADWRAHLSAVRSAKTVEMSRHQEEYSLLAKLRAGVDRLVEVPSGKRRLFSFATLQWLLKAVLFLGVVLASVVNGVFFVGQHPHFSELSIYAQLSISAIFTLAIVVSPHSFLLLLKDPGRRRLGKVISALGAICSFAGLACFAFTYGEIKPIVNVFEQGTGSYLPYWLVVAASMVLESLSGLILGIELEAQWKTELYVYESVINPRWAKIDEELNAAATAIDECRAMIARVDDALAWMAAERSAFVEASRVRCRQMAQELRDRIGAARLGIAQEFIQSLQS